MRSSGLLAFTALLAFSGTNFAQIRLPVKTKGQSQDELSTPDQKEAKDKSEKYRQSAHPLPEVRVFVPKYRPIERTVAEPILTGLTEELTRAQQLRIGGLDQPYYVQGIVEDAESFSVAATLGALLNQSQNHIRPLRVMIRLGSLLQDNGNCVYSELFDGTRYDSSSLPLDDNFLNIKSQIWLTVDRSYKTALEAISRKRAILRSLTRTEVIPDFSPASPVKLIQKIERVRVDEPAWTQRVRSLSEVFAAYPQIIDSNVAFESIQSTVYMVTSEGTQVKIPDTLSILRVRASLQAADGMPLYDGLAIPRLRLTEMPSEGALRGAVEELARNLSALATAPAGGSYVGPVLFEPTAAAQIMAEVFASQLAILRRPVVEAGRDFPIPSSELEGRLGARVLPEWMDLIDDPNRKEQDGRPLLGYYPIDQEGVVPGPVTLVERGALKNYLMTRVPVRGQETSNGRARLPGLFGAHTARISNLTVRATQGQPLASLKERLITMIRQQNKPYGLLVRKMDFPSAGSIEDLRRLSARMARMGGGRPISSPILVYRVYPDGREELVRGLRFRNLNARAFKDIVMASTETSIFDYLDNAAPMSLPAAGNYVVGCSVISPGLLFEELELDSGEGDQPQKPVVPPPSLALTGAVAGLR